MLYLYAPKRTEEGTAFMDSAQRGFLTNGTGPISPNGRDENGTEVWKEHPGFNGQYLISSAGRVKSKEQVIFKRTARGAIARQIYRERILTPRPNSDGYVHASIGGKGAGRYAVHRLVLEAFVGPCPDGMECCHNNGNPSDNRLSNLRWDTHLNNNRDRHRHGNYAVGSAHPMARIDEEMARKIAADPRATKIIAEDFGVSLNTVHRVKSGESWSHLDMERVRSPGKIYERTPRGQAHPCSRLTEDQVRAIRADPRSQYVIAEEYGIKQPHVSSIKLRQTWKHVP